MNAVLDLDSQILSWGVWDTAQPMTTSTSIQRIIGRFFNTDAEQIYVVPANMANLTGTVTYESGSRFAGIDGTGSAIENVSMSFDVNLAGGPGAIRNGQLHVLDSKQGSWDAAFQGDLANASAIMTNVTGTYGTQPLTGSIQGVFTGTGALPEFVSGFVLQSSGSLVQGITVLTSE